MNRLLTSLRETVLHRHPLAMLPLRQKKALGGPGTLLAERVNRSKFWILAGAALPLLLATPSHGQTGQTVDDLHRALKMAVCLNDWEAALAVMSPLMANPDLTATSRAELVTFRHQLQGFQETRAVVPNVAGCDLSFEQYLQARPTIDSQPQTLGADPQQAGRIAAGLEQRYTPEMEALAPTTFVQTENGMGVSAGAVGEGQSIFSFAGGAGDLVSVDIDVTEILPGSLYEDDDSQVFLFDHQGTLLYENDDLSRLQSGLQSVLLPQTGIYYIAVTTYNNDPLLNEQGQVIGWSGNGGSAIEFTLSITGVTPTAELLLPDMPAYGRNSVR